MTEHQKKEGHPAPATQTMGDTIVCDSIPIGYANRTYTELRSEPSTEFFIRIYGPHHENHPKVHPLDPALVGIAEEVKESGGHWKPCSGCYDTEDGYPTQKYAFSPALQTEIGCGCYECGGLGAVWWHMTDEQLASFEKDCMEIDAEHRREQKLATIVAPDNGTPHEVLSAVLECAKAWVPEARIIGNVRAGDIARAIEALPAEAQP